jgi:hypothetical protein
MGIVNTRNALIGWAVLKIGKRAAKKKVAKGLPSPPESTRTRAAVAAGVAAFLGVLAFWRRRSSDGGSAVD